jgi:hypothetical protein
MAINSMQVWPDANAGITARALALGFNVNSLWTKGGVAEASPMMTRDVSSRSLVPWLEVMKA